MNFSEAFQQTKHLVQFSPDGMYIASCSQYRVVIRDTDTLQILNLHTCLDPVQYLEWSPDSLFVMCGMFKRGIVQVDSALCELASPVKSSLLQNGRGNVTRWYFPPFERLGTRLHQNMQGVQHIQ